MNYWERWVGSWKKKTGHISMEAKGGYGELLDWIYANERPLPSADAEVFRIAGASTASERASIKRVLRDFFKLTADGYVQDRALEEIARRQAYVAGQSHRASLKWEKVARDKEAKAHKGNGTAMPTAKKIPESAETWSAYSTAYSERYRAAPVRNAKVNSQLKSFVQRLGADEAPAVAAFYVHHAGMFYTRAMHCTDLMLRDAEKLRTEWATGRKMTHLEAKSAEQGTAIVEQVDRVNRLLDRQ